VVRASGIQGEGSVVSGVQTKLEPFFLLHILYTKNNKKQIRIEKVRAPS